MEGGAVGHNFEMGLPKDYPSQIWFNLVQRFQRRFKCDLLSKYNSSHLKWRAGLSDIILKGTHPGTIPARFGLTWLSGFRGEDGRTTPSDGKSSHGLWPGELKS